jgi:hypothetical protein
MRNKLRYLRYLKNQTNRKLKRINKCYNGENQELILLKKKTINKLLSVFKMVGIKMHVYG